MLFNDLKLRLDLYVRAARKIGMTENQIDKELLKILG